MRAKELTPSAIVTTDESTSIMDAARLMRDKGIGDIVVTRGRETRPIGLITDRDIVVHAIACDLDLDTITVGDLRVRELATVDPEADLTEITAAMNQYGVRRVLIASDSELLGLVSMDDVIQAMAELLNNLSSMLARQVQYEKEHTLPVEAQESAA